MGALSFVHIAPYALAVAGLLGLLAAAYTRAVRDSSTSATQVWASGGLVLAALAASPGLVLVWFWVVDVVDSPWPHESTDRVLAWVLAVAAVLAVVPIVAIIRLRRLPVRLPGIGWGMAGAWGIFATVCALAAYYNASDPGWVCRGNPECWYGLSVMPWLVVGLLQWAVLAGSLIVYLVLGRRDVIRTDPPSSDPIAVQ